MLVSVIMSVNNCEKFLREAIDSILNQNLRDFEFIVIDDGSTDRSKAILEEYASKDTRIRLVSRENRGLTKSLNEGLSLARGEFIARMDADDISLPQRFEKQIGFLKKHPEVVALGSDVEMIDEEGERLGIWKHPTNHEELDAAHLRGIGGSIVHPSVMLRSSAVRLIGGYREEYRTAQDLDIFLRLGECGKLANLPVVLLRYRLHLNSVGFAKSEEQCKTVLWILKDTWRRRGLDMEIIPTPNPHFRIRPEDGLIEIAKLAEKSGELKVARKHAWRALKQISVFHPEWPHLIGIVFGEPIGTLALILSKIIRRIYNHSVRQINPKKTPK